VSDDARTLGAYIPQDRRHALAEGRELPDRQEGSTLFADLSGFTALTERLASRLGPLRGAEELGAWLRRIYDPLIACVDAEGGSVLGFAGDAVSCFFDGDDGARAVRVARAMQREVALLDDARAIDGSRLGVRVKVAVAVGQVRRFVAGDPERRLWDVMAGSTLVRLAAAEQRAEAGEILVDTAAARAAGLNRGSTWWE
jgi:class 3 adenylate cyclase